MREEAGTAHVAASVSDHSQVTAQASHSTKGLYLSVPVLELQRKTHPTTADPGYRPFDVHVSIKACVHTQYPPCQSSADRSVEDTRT